MCSLASMRSICTFYYIFKLSFDFQIRFYKTLRVTGVSFIIFLVGEGDIPTTPLTVLICKHLFF